MLPRTTHTLWHTWTGSIRPKTDSFSFERCPALSVARADYGGFLMQVVSDHHLPRWQALLSRADPTLDSLRESLGSTQTPACSTTMQRQIGTLLRHRSYGLSCWDQRARTSPSSC